MHPIPTRRQNSSCDQCRRSKRRCILPPGSCPTTTCDGRTCMNCHQLGYTCTFGFVAARTAQRRQKIATASRDALQPAPPTKQRQRPRQEASTQLDVSENPPADILGLERTEQHSAAESEVWAGLTSEDILDFLASDSSFGNLNNDWPLLAADPSPQVLTSETDFAPQQIVDHVQPSMTQIPMRDSTAGEVWHGSPIRLLNASIASQLLNKCLGDVYNTMISGIASRNLSFRCNSFSRSREHCFDPEDQTWSGRTQRVEWDSTSGLLRSDQSGWIDEDRCSWPGADGKRANPTLQQMDHAMKVTLIGVARFLDNFADLYGNRLDNMTRKKDEALLTTAVQAFALQWSPCTISLNSTSPSSSGTPGTESSSDGSPPQEMDTVNRSEAFTTAWFKVRSLLLSSTTTFSFTRLYALFLFHMTTIPVNAYSDMDVGESPNELLDVGLHQMVALKKLVERYCEKLGKGSVYRGLLESAVEMTHWFGYVRDNVSSMLSDRPCILHDAPTQAAVAGSPSVLDIVGGWGNPSMLDESVPEISQQCVGLATQMWRQVARLKARLKTTGIGGDPFEIEASMTACFATINSFNITYGQWLDQCVISFSTLSERSQASTGFLVLFWNMGILCLVEHLDHAHSLRLAFKHLEAPLKAREYQRLALFAMTTITRRILDVSGLGKIEVFPGSSDTKVPLISQHANTAVVVAALVKAIEHAISLNAFAQSTYVAMYTASNNSAIPGSWVPAVKPLLACLSALDTTVSGSHTARIAMEDLLQRYGDILMDAWTPDELGEGA